MTALVTGADSGIGLCFCHALASRGVNLVMVSNRQTELDRWAGEMYRAYKVDVSSLCLDLATSEAAGLLMRYLDANGLQPDLLVNNAGIFDFRSFDALTPDRIEIYLGLHMATLTRLTRLMAIRWKEKGLRGYVLNMSSMSCWMPMPGIAMYSATKAYIRVLSRAIAYELRDSGISVTVACPGGIATDLFGLPDRLKRFAVRIGVLQTPERFAEKALRATFRRRRQYINGWLNRISIVIVGMTPAPVRMLVKHRLLDRMEKGRIS